MEMNFRRMKSLMQEASRNGQQMVVMLITPAIGTEEKTASKPVQNETTVAVPEVAEKFEPRNTFATRNACSRRYSRYNFCRNLINLAAGKTAKSNDGWMLLSELAQSISDILDVIPETARNHIRRAEEMNLLMHMHEGNTHFVRQIPVKSTEIDFTDEAPMPEGDLPD